MFSWEDKIKCATSEHFRVSAMKVVEISKIGVQYPGGLVIHGSP